MRARRSSSSASGTLTWKGRMVAFSVAAPGDVGRGPVVVRSGIAVPLIGAGDNPTGNPSTVRDLVAICCPDRWQTAPAPASAHPASRLAITDETSPRGYARPEVIRGQQC